jgi:hypothetical protein
MDSTRPKLQRRRRLHRAIAALVALGLTAGFALPGIGADSTDAHSLGPHH